VNAYTLKYSNYGMLEKKITVVLHTGLAKEAFE